jgi:hypothetical protein
MNTDPTTNVVCVDVFEAGRSRKLMGTGPTKAADCTAVILRGIVHAAGIAPSSVQRIYSEWEPTPSDRQFIATTFPGAGVTFSFKRPDGDEWEAAFAQVAQIMLDTAQQSRPRPEGSFIDLPMAPRPATTPARKWWQFWR